MAPINPVDTFPSELRLRASSELSVHVFSFMPPLHPMLGGTLHHSPIIRNLREGNRTKFFFLKKKEGKW